MTRIANLNAYKLQPDARVTAAWNARVTAVREIGPDILGVQEIVVDERTTAREDWESEAAALVRDFAAACGLSAAVTATAAYPHDTAMANNVHRPWWTALMWNPDTVGVVEGSYRPYGAPDFWHGLTTVSFDIGARTPVLCCSYHGDPFRPKWRYDECLRIKGLLRRTGGVAPAVVLMDGNFVSAAEVVGADGRMRYYDAEPYVGQGHDDLEYQILPEHIVDGSNLADRSPSRALLRRGFMVDAAAHLNAPYEPTVGHWPDGQGDPDPWGPRRIDYVFVSRPVAPALVTYRTHKSAASRKGADHLPVYVDIDPAQIVREFAK